MARLFLKGLRFTASCSTSACFFATSLYSAPPHPDVQEIIRKSVIANQTDFKAATSFNWKEKDRDKKGTKEYQVTMIAGTPYSRLLSRNGVPLSKDKAADEMKKQQQAAAKRESESPMDRKTRIDKFEKDRRRDQKMTEELTKAFDFRYVGEQTVRGFTVWVLKATPKAGYKPPNMEAQVLPGMEGELWIDQETYNWVRVVARVIRPVSIEGFLARVEPGTRFEIEKSPVGNGIWQMSHFSMRSKAKILDVIRRSSQEDDTYFDYQRTVAEN